MAFIFSILIVWPESLEEKRSLNVKTAALSPNGIYEDPSPAGDGFQKGCRAYTSGARQ
ncbi:hypothetical protein OHAE_2181 [Ochrobactrum soli]|uniref:Uncharacterized protein n=1 Tax=Ochrobactrum soli TaxID=2448455 RepID=A0A2P9HQA5_9HYPH|nr:hypothetical protein OHAE_2181 [[Ochrobactrum] soli]